jgi:hypothetical protein
LESTTLLVANSEDSKVMVRVVLLLKVVELLILVEFGTRGMRIDGVVSTSWDVTWSDSLTDGNRASLCLNSTLLQAFEVSPQVERPEAVSQNDQGDD